MILYHIHPIKTIWNTICENGFTETTNEKSKRNKSQTVFAICPAGSFGVNLLYLCLTSTMVPCLAASCKGYNGTGH